jgi:hypothetical protein
VRGLRECERTKPRGQRGPTGCEGRYGKEDIQRETIESKLTQDRSHRFDGVVAALVEIGDEEMEDGRVFLGEVNGLRLRLEKVSTQRLLEELGLDEHVLVHLEPSTRSAGPNPHTRKCAWDNTKGG